MSKVSAQEAYDSLTKAVELMGKNHHYGDEEGEDTDSCNYFVDGRPACIVGHVLADLGKTAEEIQPIEGWRVLSDEADYVWRSDSKAQAQAAQSFFSEIFEHDALRILYAAQETQDLGDSWGNALKNADAEARKIEKERRG